VKVGRWAELDLAVEIAGALTEQQGVRLKDVRIHPTPGGAGAVELSLEMTAGGLRVINAERRTAWSRALLTRIAARRRHAERVRAHVEGQRAILHQYRRELLARQASTLEQSSAV